MTWNRVRVWYVAQTRCCSTTSTERCSQTRRTLRKKAHMPEEAAHLAAAQNRNQTHLIKIAPDMADFGAATGVPALFSSSTLASHSSSKLALVMPGVRRSVSRLKKHGYNQERVVYCEPIRCKLTNLASTGVQHPQVHQRANMICGLILECTGRRCTPHNKHTSPMILPTT